MNMPNEVESGRIVARRAANDAFRSTLAGGSLLLSPGIIALGASHQVVILARVRSCVLPGDDPCDAHDIGDVEVVLSEPGVAPVRELIFFRIHDLAPPGAAAPCRVLSLMLASEW